MSHSCVVTIMIKTWTTTFVKSSQSKFLQITASGNPVTQLETKTQFPKTLPVRDSASQKVVGLSTVESR